MKGQTINLLKKELTLGNTVQSICWFICCAGMYFIPSYPSYIGPFYITLAIMMTFALNQSSHDILYTALLPVRKIDTVKARFLYCGLLEICAIAFGVIAAIIKHFVHFPENQAGINLTFAYFGLQLIVFAVYNFLFLGNVYKDPLKPGLRYLAGAIGYFIIYAICELPVWAYYSMNSKLKEGIITQLPKLAKVGLMFTTFDSAYYLSQLLVLFGGILIFAGSWILTFARAAKQFEKYDL